jgi:hypothetical protein
MTKKELLKTFRESLEGLFADKEAKDDKEILEFYLEVCCTIAETYAEEKWIDFRDKKPTEYGRYLVYRSGCDKIQFETWNNTGWAYSNNNCTHWMPLPQKPLMS